jgi:cytochrome c oxidase cbb3-type subunit III
MTRSTMLVVCVMLLMSACKREERRLREPAPSNAASEGITVSGLHPAQPTVGSTMPSAPVNDPYTESAYAVSEGEKLYNAYNCVGCHFHGGGGIGPPLMDQDWIYGSQPQNIYQTIVEGRPNGMPSFRGKIPDYQVWEIVAYVRSLSGQLKKDVAPGRDDHMYGAKPPENSPKLQPTGPTGTEKK